jgi:diguanylate cyclase (GGDEF)-like protein
VILMPQAYTEKTGRETSRLEKSEKRRRNVFFSADLILLLTAFCFFFYNIQHERALIGLAQGIGGVAYLGLALLVFFNRRLLKIASWILTVTITGFMLGALWFSNLNVTNLVWLILPYFLSMFLLGLKSGTVIGLLYLGGIVAAVVARLGFVVNLLAPVNQLSIGIANVFALLFAASYEKERSENEKELLAKNREIEIMSHLDVLTGLFNRRFFDRALHQEFHRAKRERQPLGLIVLDIDFFKDYNDAYGHVQGDACLGTVAEAIHSSITRATDTATRYGGDEFAVLLPGTNLEGAETVSRRIEEKIKLKGIPHSSSGVSATVTLSIGIAVLSQEEDCEPIDLVRRADHAMYLSKQSGRNRITCE